MFDLLIRDALLLDGLGSAPARGDLAVTGERIAAMGKVEGSAKTTLHADGLALMPGIVDNHTHYDAQITWDPGVAPSPQLGVTTAVIGNCGFTIAPCRSGDRELVMRNLTQVEGMSLEVLRQGIRWEFETLPEYLDMLERQGAALNVAVFAGHSALRTYVMGEAATRRAATADEVGAMKALLLEAIRAGAIGFSTSTSPAHNGEGGLPMPSRLADDDEMRTLASSHTPLGRVEVATDAVRSIAAAVGPAILAEELAHRDEHSIEFQAVALRRRFPERTPAIVPLLCGGFHGLVRFERRPAEEPKVEDVIQATKAAAAALVAAGKTVAFVAAIDLAHVGARFGDPEELDDAGLQAIEEKDRAALAAAARGDAEGWFDAIAAHGDSTRICGFAAMYAMLRVAEPGVGRLLAYEPSLEQGGSVVTYGAIAWP